MEAISALGGVLSKHHENMRGRGQWWIYIHENLEMIYILKVK